MMTVDRVFGVTIVFLFFLLPDHASSQTLPSECKPAGSKSCAAYRPTDFKYQAKGCTYTPYFDSEHEAAEFAKPTFGSSYPGCPTESWEFSRWAQDERSNCATAGSACSPSNATFLICFPGNGSGPYPEVEAGYDIFNYSIYERTLYNGASCTFSQGDWGIVRRIRSVECPEGYWQGTTDSHCSRDDLGFNLISRTHQKRSIMTGEVCHEIKKKIHKRVQSRSGPYGE